MNRSRKIVAILMVFSFLFSACSCSGKRRQDVDLNRIRGSKPEHMGREAKATPVPTPVPPDATPTPDPGTPFNDDILNFTMFSTIPGHEISYDNDIRNLIAEKTGVSIFETFITGLTTDEAIGILIASGNLPDIIYSTEFDELYRNDLLVACDDYIEKYPNIKALYSDEEWDRFRADDGHIYWFDVFDRFKGKDSSTLHSEQAFWIQARVLEWANYPKIETLDQYFDLLERYTEANPEMPDGTSVIPYTCLCEDWRYYSIESAPMYLDGQPNNGCVIVNVDEGKDNPKVEDYNTSDTAKAYFKKLNEEYNKGIIDPDFSVQTYDEYISKLVTGRVLGLCDQYWDFGYSITDAFSLTQYDENGRAYKLNEIGCDYVPLGLVAKQGMEQRYHSYNYPINYSSGIAVTTSCIDPDAVFRFYNDLLSQEIMNLRFWGIEGVDYYIDEYGLFYRTEEMRMKWKDDVYKFDHCCEYSYMPQWRGVSDDRINRMMPKDRPYEFKSGLSQDLAICFEAYGANNYVDMIGSNYCEPYPWEPLYFWSNSLSYDTDYGEAWEMMGECKHEWIPKLVLSKDFDTDWDKYMKAYNDCNPDVFLDAAQAEVEARLNGN